MGVGGESMDLAHWAAKNLANSQGYRAIAADEKTAFPLCASFTMIGCGRWRLHLHKRMMSLSRWSADQTPVAFRYLAPKAHCCVRLTLAPSDSWVPRTSWEAKKLGKGGPGSAGFSSAAHLPFLTAVKQRARVARKRWVPIATWCLSLLYRWGRGSNTSSLDLSGLGGALP